MIALYPEQTTQNYWIIFTCILILLWMESGPIFQIELNSFFTPRVPVVHDPNRDGNRIFCAIYTMESNHEKNVQVTRDLYSYVWPIYSVRSWKPLGQKGVMAGLHLVPRLTILFQVPLCLSLLSSLSKQLKFTTRGRRNTTICGRRFLKCDFP